MDIPKYWIVESNWSSTLWKPYDELSYVWHMMITIIIY